MYVYTFVFIKDIIVFTGPTVYIVLPNLKTLSAYEYKQQDSIMIAWDERFMNLQDYISPGAPAPN